MIKIEKIVKNIIAEYFHIKKENIFNNCSFMDDLGADSIDTVELNMAIEHEFGIYIPEKFAIKITNVQEMIDYIKLKII
ncbi:apo-[acyl carrier protein] [Candidatus Johnevansia muelleri]|uniref:Acyl carrier protein n=1 Tax=Candidatus Johnevansia muelleri TaxID=1495769 RepID=A0A078KDY7_9GAMM|nr:apo-[acyl carrier protein] [Candidatus Evansia muelleri]